MVDAVWSGRNFLAGVGQEQAAKALLSGDQRTALRAYLLRVAPAEAFNPAAADEARQESLLQACLQALRNRVISGPGLSPDRATARRILDETIGLGPVGVLLRDPTVTSITANESGRIMVEKVDQRGIDFVPGFEDGKQLRAVMDVLARRAGRVLSAAEPVMNLVWRDPPVRVHLNLLGRQGPFMALRRGRDESIRFSSYVAAERMSQDMAAFLGDMVRAGVAILVVGMPGSGKTALLEALLHLTTPHQGHVVLIEDEPEINIRGLHHVSAFQVPKPRPREELPIGMLGMVLESLRMNVRFLLVVGEVRGDEAGAIIQVMPSYQAVWMTVHGTSPEDGLERLVSAAQMSGSRPPSPFAGGRQEHIVRRNLAKGVQLVIQMTRLADGRIAVEGLYWVRGLDGDKGWKIVPIFRVRQETEHGHLQVAWERNPDFHLPAEVAIRLAMAEAGGGSVNEDAFRRDLALAQAALEGGQPAEAEFRLVDLFGRQAWTPEMRSQALAWLRRALIAQPARWGALRAEVQTDHLEPLQEAIRLRAWDLAGQILEAIQNDPLILAAMDEMADLESISRRIAQGQRAIAVFRAAQKKVEALMEGERYWDALSALSVGREADLSPDFASWLKDTRLLILERLRERVTDGAPEADRVARAVLRSISPDVAPELIAWATRNLDRQRGPVDILVALGPGNESSDPEPDSPMGDGDDGAERTEQYVRGCHAFAAGDWQEAVALLEPLGDFRAAARLAVTARRRLARIAEGESGERGH